MFNLRIREREMLSFGCKYSVQTLNLVHNFQRLLLYSTSTNEAIESFSNYLVNSLGFSHKQALSTCTKLPTQKVNDFKFSANAHSVILFLKQYGFDDTHVRKSISLYPKLLCAKVDKTLKPKFQLLQDQGFSRSDIIRVTLRNPSIVHIGLESCTLPAIQALREILGNDVDVIAVLTRLHWQEFGYVIKNLLPNVTMLRNRGIPIDMIQKHLLWQPGALLRKPETFGVIVNRVENKLGIARHSPRYMYGIHLMSGYSEAAIESKCRLFKNFGWAQPDIDTILVKNTCCFTLSDASMKKKLNFLMNELGLKPTFLTSHSALLTCSLEKRIVPRHKVLAILNGKHLMDKIPAFYSAICMSESRFLKLYVVPFKEVREVYAKLTGCDLEMLTQEAEKIFS